MGKHVTPLGHVCCTDVAHLSPISQTPFGLKRNPACPCFCDEPRLSVPPRMITHPNLPKGKGQVTLQLITVNHISPHLASKPILPFPKGRNKLLCFVKDFSKSIQPMNISPHSFSPEGEMQVTLLLNSVNHFSPHLTSPEGEGQLLCFVKDWELQVTLVVDNLLIISHKSVCPSRALPHVPHAHIHNNTNNGISPSPSGEARWGLDGSMRSNNNFYIKTKTNIRSNLFFPFGKVRMGLRLGGG